MIAMDISWDKPAQDFVDRLGTSFGQWDDYMYHNLANDLATKMVEFIKPNVRSKTNLWGGGSGEAEKSVRSEVNVIGDGFDIAFYGNLGALYMDQGNFPASETLDSYQYGMRQFPVGRRNTGSTVAGMRNIHGMGNKTPDTPTHYSDTAADDWENGDYTQLALESLETWLNEVIG